MICYRLPMSKNMVWLLEVYVYVVLQFVWTTLQGTRERMGMLQVVRTTSLQIYRIVHKCDDPISTFA